MKMSGEHDGGGGSSINFIKSQAKEDGETDAEVEKGGNVEENDDDVAPGNQINN